MAEIIDSEANAAYDETQQYFALSFAANLVGGTYGTQDRLERILDRLLKTTLLIKLPGWRLTWGPKVFKPDPNNTDTYPTNVWYVASKGTTSVLAIAGTAPPSSSGWGQNFDVQQTVKWNEWIAKWPTQGAVPAPQTDLADDSIPTIAHGTSQGVRNILTYKSNLAAAGTNVQDFLQKQSQITQIVAVGHSMGGALAPTVALGLLQSKIITQQKIRVVASAGASPGNKQFADLWNSKFDDGNLYNSKDTVPQAWQVASGQDRCFPNIYEDIFKDQDPSLIQKIKLIVQSLGIHPSCSSGITYTPLRGQRFTSDIPIPKMKDYQKEICGVMKDQHVRAYLKELKMEKLFRDFEAAIEEYDVDGGSTELESGN